MISEKTTGMTGTLQPASNPGGTLHQSLELAQSLNTGSLPQLRGGSMALFLVELRKRKRLRQLRGGNLLKDPVLGAEENKWIILTAQTSILVFLQTL